MHTIKATSIKFAYHAIGILPILFIFLEKDKPAVAFAAAGYGLIANHFLRKELKKRFPIHERNLSTAIAMILFVVVVALMVFNQGWITLAETINKLK